MVSREHKKAAALHEKLQLLRSITNSHAFPALEICDQLPVNQTSILVDASNYIQELKQKVARLNQDIAHAQTSSDNNSWPVVAVETLEKGFQVNVYSKKSCPGLLVSVLEVFDGLGLTVLEARVLCTDTFRLEALGEEGEDNNGEGINAKVVKQAVSQAIKNWIENNDQQD